MMPFPITTVLCQRTSMATIIPSFGIRTARNTHILVYFSQISLRWYSEQHQSWMQQRGSASYPVSKLVQFPSSSGSGFAHFRFCLASERGVESWHPANMCWQMSLGMLRSTCTRKHFTLPHQTTSSSNFSPMAAILECATNSTYIELGYNSNSMIKQLDPITR